MTTTSGDKVLEKPAGRSINLRLIPEEWAVIDFAFNISRVKSKNQLLANGAIGEAIKTVETYGTEEEKVRFKKLLAALPS